MSSSPVSQIIAQHLSFKLAPSNKNTLKFSSALMSEGGESRRPIQQMCHFMKFYTHQRTCMTHTSNLIVHADPSNKARVLK